MEKPNETRWVDLDWPTKLRDRHRTSHPRSVPWPTRGNQTASGDSADAAHRTSAIGLMGPAPSYGTGRPRVAGQRARFGASLEIDGNQRSRNRRFLRIASLVCLLVWSLEIVRAFWSESPAWM